MTNLCVTDLSFGDAGKGTLVNRLCGQREFSVVVRHNGGCQAGHHVVRDDGYAHCFSQFGAGTFHRVPTFLSKYMLVEPLSLMNEGYALEYSGVESPFDLLFVSGDALVTTPYHWLLNRWREAQRGAYAHGTCGRGVGATQEYALDHPDALRVVDLIDERVAVEKLADIRAWAEVESGQAMPPPREVFDKYEEFRHDVRIGEDAQLRADARTGPILFEGAQGVLLDEDWGFHPHTTWSRTTPVNAQALCDEYGLGPLEVVGITRAYTTRHGAGPFVAEDPDLNFPELHNNSDGFQGSWRVGHFDGPAIQYATRAVRSSHDLIGVYVTHVDSVRNEPNAKLCVSYRKPSAVARQPILPLLFDQFDGRELQTRKLGEAVAVLTTPRKEWPESIAEYLDLPLAGWSEGPLAADGREVSATAYA